MAEHPLTASSPLGGYREAFDGLSVEERPNVAIVSIAVPHEGRPALEKAMFAAYGVSLPVAGKAIRSSDRRTRFLGMSADQVFALFDDPTADAVPVVAANLGDCGYFTMQSGLLLLANALPDSAPSISIRPCFPKMASHGRSLNIWTLSSSRKAVRNTCCSPRHHRQNPFSMRLGPALA